MSTNLLKNKNVFVDQLIDHVTCICKKDKSFTINEKLNNADEHYKILLEKYNKLNDLVNRSTEIKINFREEIENIKEKNLNVRKRIIERLDSKE